MMGAEKANALSRADDQAVKAVVGAYATAWNRHDMKAMADLFTEDAEWVNIVGMHWRGEASVMKAHEVYHQIMFATTDLNATSVAVRAIAPDVAVAVVEYSVGSFKTPAGQEIKTSRDRLSCTVVKRGQWCIAHGHNTVIDPQATPYDPVNAAYTGQR